MARKLKVFGVPWHVAHQYEIAKLPWVDTYDILINPYRGWGETHRPFPPNCNWVPYYEPGKYDLAILHVDQQCIYDPDKGDRIHKGRLYQEVNEQIQDIPKVVINHMTPFHDKYESEYVIEAIKKAIGDNLMVVNSYEAKRQWGWGHVVIHGLEVDEWWDLPKEPRVVTVLSTGGMEKAYRRIFLHQVIRFLREDKVPFTWIGADKKCKSFEDYRDYLGRSLIYFSPTWQSPRPRARTEAMLSGCCIVTTPYHMWTSETNEDSYIKEATTGFLTSRAVIKDPRIMDNPRYTADILRDLVLKTPDFARTVGQAGKEYAREHFNKKTFEDQWEGVLKRIL